MRMKMIKTYEQFVSESTLNEAKIPSTVTTAVKYLEKTMKIGLDYLDHIIDEDGSEYMFQPYYNGPHWATSKNYQIYTTDIYFIFSEDGGQVAIMYADEYVYMPGVVSPSKKMSADPIFVDCKLMTDTVYKATVDNLM